MLPALQTASPGSAEVRRALAELRFQLGTVQARGRWGVGYGSGLLSLTRMVAGLHLVAHDVPCNLE